MHDKLDILKRLDSDHAVTEVREIEYPPENRNKTGYNDDIVFNIFSNDGVVDLSKSHLHITGKVKLVKTDPAGMGTAFLSHNFAAHMFRKISYEMNNQIIDYTNDPGLVSSILAATTMDVEQLRSHENSGMSADLLGTATTEGAKIDIRLELSNLLGFFYHYKKYIPAQRHSLTLTRAKDDTNCFHIGHGNIESIIIDDFDIRWVVPHIKFDTTETLRLSKIIEADRAIPLDFRHFGMHELAVQENKAFDTWSLLTLADKEMPQFVIVGFKKERRYSTRKNVNMFDGAGIRSVQVLLNEIEYPHNLVVSSFEDKDVSYWYQKFCDAQNVIAGKEGARTIVDKTNFMAYYPLYCIDTSAHKDLIKPSVCDLQIKFEAKTTFAASIICHALLFTDKRMVYHALSGIVKNT